MKGEWSEGKGSYEREWRGILMTDEKGTKESCEGKWEKGDGFGKGKYGLLNIEWWVG